MSHSLYISSLQQLQVPNECIARKNEGFNDKHTNVIGPQTYKLETRFRLKEQKTDTKIPNQDRNHDRRVIKRQESNSRKQN